MFKEIFEKHKTMEALAQRVYILQLEIGNEKKFSKKMKELFEKEVVKVQNLKKANLNLNELLLECRNNVIPKDFSKGVKNKGKLQGSYLDEKKMEVLSRQVNKLISQNLIYQKKISEKESELKEKEKECKELKKYVKIFKEKQKQSMLDSGLILNEVIKKRDEKYQKYEEIVKALKKKLRISERIVEKLIKDNEQKQERFNLIQEELSKNKEAEKQEKKFNLLQEVLSKKQEAEKQEKKFNLLQEELSEKKETENIQKIEVGHIIKENEQDFDKKGDTEEILMEKFNKGADLIKEFKKSLKIEKVKSIKIKDQTPSPKINILPWVRDFSKDFPENKVDNKKDELIEDQKKLKSMLNKEKIERQIEMKKKNIIIKNLKVTNEILKKELTKISQTGEKPKSEKSEKGGEEEVTNYNIYDSNLCF